VRVNEWTPSAPTKAWGRAVWPSPEKCSTLTDRPRAWVTRSKFFDPEPDVDIGKAFAGVEQRLGQVGPVQHAIGSTELFVHRLSQRQRYQRRRPAKRININALRLKTGFAQGFAQAKPVQHPAGVGGYLHAGAVALRGFGALQNHDLGLEPGQRQGQGQPGNARPGDINGSGVGRHFPGAQARPGSNRAETGSQRPAVSLEL